MTTHWRLLREHRRDRKDPRLKNHVVLLSTATVMTLYRRGAQLLFCPSNIENARGCSCMTGNYGARTHAILSGTSSLLLLRLR